MKEIEQIREKISRYDFEILDLAKKRSEYLLNRKFFKSGIVSDLVIWSKQVKNLYIPIIAYICKEGDDKNQWEHLKKLDHSLFYSIISRCDLGIDIARCKSPIGLPVYVPEIEAKKIKELKEKGIKLGLEGKAVEGMFKLIMNETKRIEDIVLSSASNGGSSAGPIQIYKAGTEDTKKVMTTQAEDYIKKLEKEQGGRYSIKVKDKDKDKEKGGPWKPWIIELHRR